MERRYLNEFLRDITSTNTPGTNAVLRHHEALSRDFVPRSDLVLFVTSADRPFPESERDYPGIMHDWDKKIVLIVNKVDLLEAGERDETWDGDRGAPRSPYQASSLRRHLLALLASIPAGVDGLCVIRWQRPTIGSPPRTWCFHPGGGESHKDFHYNLYCFGGIAGQISPEACPTLYGCAPCPKFTGGFGAARVPARAGSGQCGVGVLPAVGGRQHPERGC